MVNELKNTYFPISNLSHGTGYVQYRSIMRLPFLNCMTLTSILGKCQGHLIHAFEKKV